MSREITYDTAADAEVIKGHPEEVSEAVINSSEPAIDAQLGCHSGSTMKTAAENNQNSERAIQTRENDKHKPLKSST